MKILRDTYLEIRRKNYQVLKLKNFNQMNFLKNTLQSNSLEIFRNLKKEYRKEIKS